MKIKMNIGILTFHAAYNYGAFLQTYALNMTLKKMGNDVTVINYCPKYGHGATLKPTISHSSHMSKTLCKIIQYIMNYTQVKHRNKYFYETISQNLVLSKVMYSSQTEPLNPTDRFDLYIAGSDQIWAPQLTGGKLDPAFFFYNLPVSAKTCTYAASMGRSAVHEEHQNDFREYTKSLNAISVRECSAVPFVQEQTGKDVQCVLDPTLLLTAEEWEKYAVEPKKHPQKFLLSYSFGTDPEYFRAVKAIAKKSGLEIVWLHNKGVFCKYFVRHNYVRPEEFVWYFANASAIITPSFHGTMFSIINRKPFYSVAPYPQSVRIEDHLKRFGLLDRLYDSSEKLPDTVTDIDYTESSEKLEEWRRKSFAYLDMITKSDDEQ